MVAVLSAPETARVDLARAVRDRGALVLRDAARDVDGFALLAARMGSVRQDIACSAGPRARVRDGVFTANEAPPDQYICIHHEMAQCEHPPEFVLFYCDTPPADGGCTPCMRSSAVCADLHRRFPRVFERLRAEGVRYRRVFPSHTDDTSALGKSWRERFLSESKDAVERACTAEGARCEWLADGSLRTTGPIVYPIVAAPNGDGPLLFVAAESSFGGGGRRATTAVKEIVHADGRPLEAEVLHALVEVAERARRDSDRFAWQRGDVLAIHNGSVMHSRDAFDPPRRILVCLVGTMANPTMRDARHERFDHFDPGRSNSERSGVSSST